MVEKRVVGGGIQDSGSMKTRIRNAPPSNYTCIGLVCETPVCDTHIKCTGSICTSPLQGLHREPIHATRALIGRALVLMTLNPFERVAVSLKLVSMLFHCSSPPASLVFDVFFMWKHSRMTFENGIWFVREISFLLVEFSQPGYYFSINPNIW